MRRYLLILVSVAACVRDPTPPSTAASEDSEPAGMTEVHAQYLLDAIDAWTDAVLASAFVDPESIADQMLSYAEPDCPIWAPSERGELWTGTPCTTSRDVRFYGAYLEVLELGPGLLALLDQPWIVESVQREQEDWTPQGAQLSDDARVFSSHSRVRLPFGRELSLSGEYHGVQAAWPGVDVDVVTLSGPWWNTVLEVRPEPSLTMLRFGTSQGEMVLADGLVQLPREDVEVVVGEAVRLADHRCPLEPTGTLRVRTLEHEWFEVTFDAPCDGCGEVHQHGTYLGTICMEGP